MIREKFSNILDALDSRTKEVFAELDVIEERRNKVEARIAELEKNLDELSECDLAVVGAGR